MVWPKYPDTFWSFRHSLKFIGKKAAFAPLGLLTVGAMLPTNWSKKLIDINVEALKDEDIAWADIVMVSAMIVQKESAQAVLIQAKEAGKITIAGGPVFTTGHEGFTHVDHFVLGEAEVTLPLFLADFAKGQACAVYQSDIRPTITETPIPLWSLIAFKNYATMAVQNSRGCPFNCEFCDIIVMNGRKPRVKDAHQLVCELDSLKCAGWQGAVFIVDDNFIGNKPRVKEMLPKLIAWQKEHGYPFKLFTEASVNLAADDELLVLMRDANFFKVFLGIETPIAESLEECRKTQNTGVDLAEAVRKIQRHGMQVMGGFIVGFDTDPKHIFTAQVDFIQKTGIVTAMVGLLNALPKTALWYRLEKEGRILRDTAGNNLDGILNFVPRMDTQYLINGYKSILNEIYSPKKYYERVHRFMHHYKPAVRGTVSRVDIIAFAKSVWHIGIWSRSNYLYWQLLIRTFFTKIKAFPLAVELAIQGEHFRKIVHAID